MSKTGGTAMPGPISRGCGATVQPGALAVSRYGPGRSARVSAAGTTIGCASPTRSVMGVFATTAPPRRSSSVAASGVPSPPRAIAVNGIDSPAPK